MTRYLLVFLAGFAGSMHCIGMCGGFACALGADTRGRVATLGRHLVYNLGRVTTYCFLGAVVGQLGGLLLAGHGEGTWAGFAQRSLAVLSGLLMVFIGLQFFGWLRPSPHGFIGAAGGALARGLRHLIAVPGFRAPLAFGVANGFLPCPLVYAFAAQAAASGGPLDGLLIMAAFGLGTFPAMLAMGGIGLGLRARAGWRLSGVRIAGGFIVLLGVVTFARGVLPMTGHLHGL